MEYLCIMLNVINDDGCVNCNYEYDDDSEMVRYEIFFYHTTSLFQLYFLNTIISPIIYKLIYFQFFKGFLIELATPLIPFLSYTYMDFHSYRISYKFIIQSIFFQNRIFGKFARNSIEKLYRKKSTEKKERSAYLIGGCN